MRVFLSVTGMRSSPSSAAAEALGQAMNTASGSPRHNRCDPKIYVEISRVSRRWSLALVSPDLTT